MGAIATSREYQRALKEELKGVDSSLVVDALDDAEEFIDETAGELLASGAVKDRERAEAMAVRRYGSPRSVAREYLKRSDDTEKRAKERAEPAIRDVFGIYLHKETYLGLIYLLMMFPLGMIYFVFMVVGFSLAASLSVILVGLPLLVLMFVGVYGIAHLHGRFTEFMLGMRMPRRRRRMYLVGTPWKKLRTIFLNPRVYSSTLYLLLMLPLGIIYFCVLATLLAVSVSFIALPFVFLFPGQVDGALLFRSETLAYLVTGLGAIFGFTLLTWTLHLSNLIWFVHGKMSQLMLLKR